MKRIFALLLCVALVIALPVGCKKKADKVEPEAVTEKRIGNDLMSRSDLYYLSHVGTINSFNSVKIVEKDEDGDTLSLSVTANMFSNNAEISLAADMTYTLVANSWKLDTVTVNKAVPTLTGGPDKQSVLMDITNYVQNNPTTQENKKDTALAMLGEERHLLAIDLAKVTWEMKNDLKTKTAKLYATQKTGDLTFTGYYNLTFDDTKGWIIESEKQDNGFYYLLMRLEAMEQKETSDEK